MHKRIITNIVIYSEPQSHVFQQAGYFVGGGWGAVTSVLSLLTHCLCPMPLYIVSENM